MYPLQTLQHFRCQGKFNVRLCPKCQFLHYKMSLHKNMMFWDFSIYLHSLYGKQVGKKADGIL